MTKPIKAPTKSPAKPRKAPAKTPKTPAKKAKAPAKAETPPPVIVTGFKGFTKDLKCRDMQYEIGQTYEVSEAKLCNTGLHFCEAPFDVFGYYPPAESRFALVEAENPTNEADGDTKRVTKKLTIKAELDLKGLLEAGIKFALDRVDWSNKTESNTGDYSAATNTGDYSAATNTGDYSAATNTGNRSAATNTGDYSAATVEGQESVAASLGIEGRAKASLGSWIVLAEWVLKDDGWHRTAVKSAQVDGETIKADTFYMLVNGEFTESED